MARTTKKSANDTITTSQKLAALLKSARDIMRKDKGLNGDLDRLPMLTWIMFLKFLDDLETIRQEEADLSGEQFRPLISEPYRWRDWAAFEDGISGPELLYFINQERTVLTPAGCWSV
jgi:type I restriction enzyme M protein